jgi:hypothetical protein
MSYKDNQVSFVRESEDKKGQRQLVELSVENQPVKRRIGGCEMATSLGVSQL